MGIVNPKRYVPGPGDPVLPPQLAQLANKTTDDVMKELNRLPFFMTQLDETDGDGGENLELEALKALAYEGEPDEIATNFKNQGNEQFKLRHYQAAIEFYNKGLGVGCKVPTIDASLYLNRAACNLELKNYRRCINDCKECLQIDPKSIKAYYRMSKAFLAIERFDDAQQAIEFSLRIDNHNAASNSLLEQIILNRQKIEAKRAKLEILQKEKESIDSNLQNALRLRNYTVINTSHPSELLQDAKLSLEDPHDVESQLILPALVLYPTISEFDFIAATSELNTPLEILETVLQRPPEWFEDPRHQNFRPKKIDAYMETDSGGLIKVGKNITFNKALSTLKPIIPLFDNALKVYFVPRVDAEHWLSNWDKETILKKRSLNS